MAGSSVHLVLFSDGEFLGLLLQGGATSLPRDRFEVSPEVEQHIDGRERGFGIGDQGQLYWIALFHFGSLAMAVTHLQRDLFSGHNAEFLFH
jgi:hypothetical protein